MSNENALVQFESGVIAFPMQALTDLGDHITFDSPAAMFSQAAGSEPVVRVDGIINGGTITPNTGNNSVLVSTILANLAGVETTIVGAAVAITRPATNVAKVISITVNSAGALAAVLGTDGSNTTFSETRGAAGGPPLIPVGSIEVGQIRIATSAASAILKSQIFQIDGTHREMADFPVHTVDDVNGQVKFSSALSLIHTGTTTKAVYASFSEPLFQDQPFGNDFVPAEESTSVSSTQVYGAVVGSSSKSLSAASFTAVLKDGITDAIIGKKGQKLWFRFFQDKSKLPHILTLGTLALGRTFSAADQPKVTCTIAATVASVEKAS